jgi:hypothetical protein
MVSARPFRPYLIKLADGQSFEIRHPELVSCSVNGREMQINTEQGLVLVEMLLVVSMSPVSSDSIPAGVGVERLEPPVRKEGQSDGGDPAYDPSCDGEMPRQQAAPQPQQSTGYHESEKTMFQQPAEGVESRHTTYDRANETEQIADEMPRHALCSRVRSNCVRPGCPIITLATRSRP